jgi:asparagine synthase (glutamine-hydrolysing)
MCGIAGQYCLNAQKELSESILQDQSAVLRHRGPDDEGHWMNTVVGMCHRRLAILDPERAHQPMHGPRGTVLTYNGEIYNHRQLRAELEARGHPFRTNSDAEVLLAAYEEWGSAAWHRLNGMFAFALWDERQRSLYLVRDRLGIKPLFYTNRGDRISFASEPSALLSCPEVSSDIDPEIILSFLFYYQPLLGDRTLFRDIRALQPGCELMISESGVHERRWWEPKVTPCGGGTAPDETITRGKLRYLLHSAIQRQMIADVPIGAYLSGGLDSTILVGLMAETISGSPPTYTICIEGDEDEAEFASIVARSFNTKHKSYIVSAEEYFQATEKLARIRQSPLVVPNEVLIYLLATHVAPEVKVVLTGEGADELFGGYSNILSALNAHTASFSEESGVFDGTSAPEKEWSALFSSYSWFSKEELRPLLKPHLCQILESGATDSVFVEYFRKLKHLTPLQRTLTFLEQVHLPALLGRLDGAMMAASVEGRVPYTDYQLVEYVLNLGDAEKLPDSLKPDKYLLRKTFEDLVPTPILKRSKKAFPVPLERLFETRPGKATVGRILNCDPIATFFDREALKRWIQEGKGPGFALQMWKLLSLAMFFENRI